MLVCNYKTMKKIQLTKGEWTIVDDEDFELVSQYKWCASPNHKGKTTYARTGIWNPETKKVKTISLHRLLMGFPVVLEVDHINGKGLDNRRSNLRVVNRTQQSQNRPLRSDNKSGYKGVYWLKPNNKWRALIKYNGKRISLGLFDDIKKAAKAYEIASSLYFGKYRRLI